MDHETSERDGYFLNDDKQLEAWESFQGSGRHPSNNSSLFACWEPVNIQRKHFQLDGT